MFSALSLLYFFLFSVSFFFVVFFEALVLKISLSFKNIVSRSWSTLLKAFFSSLVSHETMADLIMSFNLQNLKNHCRFLIVAISGTGVPNLR